MGTSLSDVAALARVAPITVSRVLHGSPLVTDATRARVLEACRQTGYQPHAGARALRSKRFNTVGLLLSTEHTYLPQALLAGMVDALERGGLALHVMRLTDEQLTNPDFAPRVLAERMVDGLLINYTVLLPERMVRQIREHHLPSIWVNIKEPTDCVYPDMYKGACAAVGHLLRLGHRHIAYVDFVNDVSHPEGCHYSVGDAWAGCREAVAAHGGGARLSSLGRGFINRGSRVALMREWLRSADRPTAIFTASNHHALACLQAALSLGLCVPQDLSLATYHNAPVCDESGLAFATAGIPESDLGRTAVDLLMDKIRRPRVALPSVAVDLTFTPGESCAPPPATV